MVAAAATVLRMVVVMVAGGWLDILRYGTDRNVFHLKTFNCLLLLLLSSQ